MPVIPFMIFSVGLVLKSTVMEAAMPAMTLTLVLFSQYKLDHVLTAVVILFTIILSLLLFL
jgi:predicted permease